MKLIQQNALCGLPLSLFLYICICCAKLSLPPAIKCSIYCQSGHPHSSLQSIFISSSSDSRLIFFLGIPCTCSRNISNMEWKRSPRSGMTLTMLEIGWKTQFSGKPIFVVCFWRRLFNESRLSTFDFCVLFFIIRSYAQQIKLISI